MPLDLHYHDSLGALAHQLALAVPDLAFIEQHELQDPSCELLSALLEPSSAEMLAQATLFQRPGASAVEWCISIGSVNAAWSPKHAYPDIIDSMGLLESTLILSDVNLWYSSFDFEGERWYAALDSADQANEIRRIAGEVAPGWSTGNGLMRAGVNFIGKIDVGQLLGDALCEWVGVNQLIPVTGATGIDEQGVFVELACSIKGASCNLLDGKLQVALRRVRARVSGLDEVDSNPTFTFTFEGEVTIGGNSVNVTLGAAQHSQIISVLIEADDQPQCQGWLESLLPEAIDQITLPSNQDKAIPDDQASAMPCLQRFHAIVPLAEGRPNATVTLGYKDEITLFKDLVNLRPSLTVSTDFTSQGTRVKLESQWILKPDTENESRFDVVVRLPECEGSIVLTPGYRLSLPQAISDKLKPVRNNQSALHLVHMVLEGNVRTGDFQLEIHTAGHMAFQIHDTALTLGDIEFAVSRDQGDWYASLSAVLTLGDYDLLLAADIGKKTSFSVNVQQISLSNLCVDLFKIEPHEALEQAFIDHCSLQLDIGEGIGFSFEAASRSEVQIAGIGIQINEFQGSYSTGKQLNISGKAQLKAGDTHLSLDLSYAAGTWQFKADATTQLDLAALIKDMAGVLGFESPLPLEALDITSFALDVRLGSAGTRLAIHCGFSMGSKREHHLMLVAGKVAGEDRASAAWHYLLEIGELAIDLFRTPLIGGTLRSVADAARSVSSDPRATTTIGLDHLAVRLASTCDEPLLDLLFQGLDTKRFARPVKLTAKASVHADITVLDYHKVLDYPPLAQSAAEHKQPETQPATRQDKQPELKTSKAAAQALAPAADKGYWLPLDRSIGGVTLERIGVAADAAAISLMVDASANFGPVKLGLMGLQARTPLKLPLAPEFSLKGLSVSATTEALRLSGGLVVREKNSYAGAVTIGFGKVALTAMGTYCETAGTGDEPVTSHVALLAILDTPLGGPPMFFVNGLAGGVGYNMSWKDVPLADLGNHAMVKAIENSAADGNTLARFGEINEPKAGDHWVAVGVKFTSFKIINGVALLVLSQGQETRLQILAKLDLTFPPKAVLGNRTPLVHADILMRAEFRPAAGELKVDGMLGPGAFLLSEKAVISGGFALYCWFAPSRHAGDFVLTLGGYHPRFNIPAHYPRVERLALNWKLSDQVQIKGEQYFALTPSAVMAGGLLEVNYRASWGSASFKAQADFIIFFQPFAYQASVRIAVHVDAQLEAWPITLKLSLDLAVSMEIWGPPFGALATISFYGLTKDIALGADRPVGAPTVSWENFRSSFLPLANAGERKNNAPKISHESTHTDSLITLAASNGLIARLDADSGKLLGEDATPLQVAGAHWLVDPGNLSMELGLCIPARTLALNGVPQPSGAAFGIGPMNLTHEDLISEVSIVVESKGDWQLEAVRSPVAIGLWSPLGRPAAGSPPEQQMLEGVLTGVQLSLGVKQSATFDTIRMCKPVANTRKAWWVLDPACPVVTDPDLAILRTTLADAEVDSQRNEILTTIRALDNDIYGIEQGLGKHHGLYKTARVSTLGEPYGLNELVNPESGVFADTPAICRWDR